MPKVLKFPSKGKASLARFTNETTSHHGILFQWRTDACGLLREVPDEWIAITGQSVAEALEIGWMHAIHPDDSERVIRRWFRGFGSATPLKLEFRVLSVTGEYAAFRCHAEPVFNTEGRITHWEGESIAQVKITPRLIIINE